MNDDVRNDIAASSSHVSKLSESLRQSEERFRLMVEAVKDYAIFLLDPEGHVASWNLGAERMKGYTDEEIIGKHFSIFYPPDVVERGWPAHELEMAVKQGTFEDEGWRVRKDGCRFWANVVLTPLYDNDGRLWGFTKVTRDLTERYNAAEAVRRADEALKNMNRELVQRNQELQDFAYVASHDLQEPLRKINAFAELLEQEYEEVISGDGQMYLGTIRNAARRMSTLINDLLAYSRLNTRAPSFKLVDLNRIVEEVLSDLGLSIEEQKGRVEVDALPVVEADPTQMRQLFQNLLSNAIKFHKPDVPPTIHVSLGDPGRVSNEEGREMYQIVVIDNGIGFDEKYLDKIFAPFQRLHTRREFPGTGVGLAICKRIVERHEGSINAYSKPGEGTTFIVHLPVSGAGADAEA